MIGPDKGGSTVICSIYCISRSLLTESIHVFHDLLLLAERPFMSENCQYLIVVLVCGIFWCVVLVKL